MDPELSILGNGQSSFLEESHGVGHIRGLVILCPSDIVSLVACLYLLETLAQSKVTPQSSWHSCPNVHWPSLRTVILQMFSELRMRWLHVCVFLRHAHHG